MIDGSLTESPVGAPADSRPTRSRVLVISGSGIAAILLLVGVGMAMTASRSWTAREMNVLEAVSRAHVAALDALALAINTLFSPRVAATIVVMVAVIIWVVTRRLRTTVQFVGIVSGSWLGTDAIKVLVHRPRPDGSLLAHPLIHEASNSYPSGHTAFAASLALTLIVLARGRRWQPAIVVIGAASAVVVAWSRVYLGVHYVSDVTASLVYSVVVVSTLSVLWERFAATAPVWDRAARRPVSRLD
ncbi:phosphatase PAP2 family protein [Lacisediminihabitans changchengi]|uniref:Phosphatase PAP2 family protein n=1 Tax=Lacisediminihabitans changchengi TaxID=2787634 RepID=A0A934SL92_9MICO|nr:phosphatase PAP2 family protein [Lacisediminihabitans changchengi]MBK4346992.1 phosphatase PAP2 family protein [Lacisediminihabitans changchengi]MBK4347885.1 phosphatase PAP2 family protein [Lacisediminihabitans changchengi]